MYPHSTPIYFDGGDLIAAVLLLYIVVVGLIVLIFGAILSEGKEYTVKDKQCFPPLGKSYRDFKKEETLRDSLAKKEPKPPTEGIEHGTD